MRVRVRVTGVRVRVRDMVTKFRVRVSIPTVIEIPPIS